MKSSLIAAAAALFAGCGVGAPDYPEFAQNAYRIEGLTHDPNGGAPTRTVIYRDGPLMRVEASLPQYGPAVVVFDQATNAAYVIASTASNTAPASAPAQPAAPGQTAAAPAAPATGVAVRLADADAPQPMETAWAALGEDNARSVGRCEVAGERGHEWAPRDAAAGVERTACISDDGIVMRVRENNMVLWEATALERGPQAASLFGVPQGYRMIDPQAVAEGVGERQLDSVTGAPEQPPPRG
jgi:hypothetical protein